MPMRVAKRLPTANIAPQGFIPPNQHDHPGHIYLVPHNPAICPVLALCKHLMANPKILSGKEKLFAGPDQYGRFNDILRNIFNAP